MTNKHSLNRLPRQENTLYMGKEIDLTLVSNINQKTSIQAVLLA